MKKNQIITFTKLEDGKIRPDRQLVNSFLVSKDVFLTGAVEIRTLTIRSLIAIGLKNEFKESYYKIIRCLYLSGFIDVGEAEQFTRKCFTLVFWRTLQKRHRYIKNIECTQGLRRYAK